MKLIEEPYENPELVLNSCEDLKSRFLIDLKSNVEVIEAESFFDDLSEKLALFESIVSNFPESNLTDVKKFIDEMSEIASFFDESELNISDLTSNELSAFNSELESKSEFSDSLLKKVVQEIFYSYYSLDFFKSENKNLARISFDNKGKEIKEYFEVYIPLDTSNAEKVFSTGNITYVSKDDETILKFSGLLKGLNSIIFDLNLNNIQQSDSNKTEPVFFDLDNISEITKILAEKNELVKKSELISNSDEIKKIELEIEDLTKNNKLDEAKQKLLLLKDEINLIEKENENNEKNSAKEFIELILEIEINKEKLLEKTEFTESIFSSLNENELPEVYAFSPITFQRAQELKKIAQKKLGVSSAELNKLFSESKFFEILAFKESINTDIISSEIETALNEVDSATEKMKQNALSAYNVAVSKRNSSTSNSTADELLLKSKKNLEEKNYLESILQSNNAIGFLVIPKDPGFEIPLTVYPMLLVIFSVLGYMYWRSKKEEEPKPIKIIKKAE